MNTANQNAPVKNPPPIISEFGKPPLIARPGQPSRQPLSRRGAFRPVLILPLVFLIVCACVGFAAIKSKLGNSSFAHQKQQLAALDALCSLEYPAQTSNAQALCTTQGFTIFQSLVSESGLFAPSTFKVIGAKANPKLTDIEMVRDTAEGRSRIFVRMVDRGGWKFHDVYIAEHNGKKVNHFVSYMKEHPLLTFWESNGDDILKTTEQTIDVIQKLKSLFGEDHQRQACSPEDSTPNRASEEALRKLDEFLSRAHQAKN